MKKSRKNYITRNIITFLDIILALFIIASSYQLSGTIFGKTAITFGFIMLIIATFVLILQKI